MQKNEAMSLLERARYHQHHGHHALMRVLFLVVILMLAYYAGQPNLYLQPNLFTMLKGVAYILIPLCILDAAVCMAISRYLRRKAARVLMDEPSIGA